MAPAIDAGTIASLGTATQMPYDPFSNPQVAAFQEPGEIIAEGLFSLLNYRQFSERLATSIWRHFIQLRRSELAGLMARATDSRHREALKSAIAAAEAVTPKACVDFIRYWDLDRSRWPLA